MTNQRHAARPQRKLNTTELTCDQCGKTFQLTYAFQRIALRNRVMNACSQACRKQLTQRVPITVKNREMPMRIAVLNQKGGTGKTTTSVNLAAGLAQEGHRVLLIDVDSQGHSAISLGVKTERSLYHVIVKGHDPRTCIVNARKNLDLLAGTEQLAVAELFLARLQRDRHNIMRTRMSKVRNYDFVILDCAPSLSSLNMNALLYSDQLLVPVQCDWLSMIGVRQLMKTVKNVNEHLNHPITLLGVLPTFYDQRNRISNESVRSLQAHFGEKVMKPIRVNTRLKEAPSYQKSIFDYAPRSRGAEDYRRLVKNVIDYRKAWRAANG